MSLRRYAERRDFERTPEPRGDGPAPAERRTGRSDPVGGPADGRLLVVHKHDASRLHYDLRLEHDGALLSWAVPKGPSLDPSDRRLAVRVEDHPLDYGGFEGVIPEGEYGAGTVLLWDRGSWEPEGDVDEGLEAGKLSFELRGRKLRGRWTLVRMDDGDDDWLLVKGDDEAARTSSNSDLLAERGESVATGRGLEQILERRPPRVDAAGLPGARRAALPERPRPQLATRVSAPPDGDEWLHEIKLDGYRVLALLSHSEVTLLTRRGNDWTDRFRRPAAALARLPTAEAVLDGEMVALLSDGTTDFQRLQQILAGEHEGSPLYFAFDLLHLDGHDLGRVPLAERKEALAELLDAASPDDDPWPENGGSGSGRAPLRYSDHVRGGGGEFHRQACTLALEGTISKRADGVHRPGRSREWRKIKCVERQEFVVGGYTDPSGARQGFGALLLGYHDPGGSLCFAGRVGTGFTDRSLRRLRKALERVEREDPPFADPPRDGDVHWTEPGLVVEVEFTEWTNDGVLRHPSFKGVRHDRDPREVERERPVAAGGGVGEGAHGHGGGGRGSGAGGGNAAGAGSDGGGRRREPGGRSKAVRVRGVRLTHPDRVLYPEQGVTKRRLVEHYERVGDRMLEHAGGRPLTLLRCPRGTGGECFYQKNRTEGVPDDVGGVEVETSDGVQTYMAVDSVEGLIALVQIGTLEIHLWGARADRLERPDRIVFDLDPGPGVAWSAVVEGARAVRSRLRDAGLRSFVMTTGGKGLHVTVPIVRRNEWDEVKQFARGLAEGMVEAAPGRYVAKASKAAREGRVFVDYLRNTRGATAIAPYSTRARPGATVAVPLRWDELGPGVRSDRYDVENVPRRLAGLGGDPWEGFSEVRQSVTRNALETVDA